MDNSYLGLKVLTSNMKAVAERDIDRHNFINQWRQDPRHVGSPLGAEEVFNEKFPMQDYLDKELGPYGLDHTGKFHDVRDVGKLYGNGAISEKQFRAIIKKDGLVE
jgi:hypothetical protein